MNKLHIFLSCIIVLGSCESTVPDNHLFEQFQDPAADARPMVRWWWNGNAVDAAEIKRELVIMKEAGIGGVEINSIAMPPHVTKTSAKSLRWAGPEWIRMVKTAALEAKELGMITDLIVGSGWPFGGRFLKESETMQRLGVKKLNVRANTTIDLDIAKFLTFKSEHAPGSGSTKETSDVELHSVKLIPKGVKAIDEIKDITSQLNDHSLHYQVDNRDYVLVFVFNERHFKTVYHGSPGADGPIMDHYKTEVVMSYLNRLKAIEKETGLSLSQLIRALFCDSIELAGSNWTDDMAQQFEARNGYDITPYLPFVIQPHKRPNTYDTAPSLQETIRRAQYDFYHTIIDVFLERFTTVFQKFCTDNGVLCRYQAYGTPYYMGLFQGNMIPDIPESNNWIYSGSRDEAATSAHSWVQGHGYLLWNKAASSGAHLMGRKITSCEAMTNVQGVFRTSLETVKQSDDINFITGMNHAVLHGYNYSPPDAGFPGWIRYGAYFSEQNTWWPYFRHWADYNARLSAVFQNSKPTADIAILGPLRDLWGEVGPIRPPFNLRPWYYAKLWEPISHLGSTCDYIHQAILETAHIEGQELICGNMGYKAIILADVESLTPEAAAKLNAFAKAGGKIALIGKTPGRSLSLVDAAQKDALVKNAINNMISADNVIQIPTPAESTDLISWTKTLKGKMNLTSQVQINKPSNHLYFTHHYNGTQDIYFFVNSDRKRTVDFEATFPTNDKIPYVWIPSTGERFRLTDREKNKLHIRLDGLESTLIVYEPADLDLPQFEYQHMPQKMNPLKATWEVAFEQVDGQVFHETMQHLINFRSSDHASIRNFAGTVTYSTILENDGEIRFLQLSEVNEGITEVALNGEKVGMKWYGNHRYDLGPFINKGENTLSIKLTTTLANYCASLKDNPVSQEWTKHYETPLSSGLVGVEVGE